MQKIGDKQFTIDLINHNKKETEFFEGRKKKKAQKNNTTLKVVAKAVSLSITYQKKENQS